jgi:AsmA-like C-terminal region
VSLKDGTATFSSLSFRVPGALARLHGTYNVVNQRIDLRGTLLMQAKLSQATSGVKSFLLKVLDPLLKKNHRGGAKMPVRITGTYSRPSYRSDPI